MEVLRAILVADRAADLQAGHGDDRYVCGFRLLERLVPGIPVHTGYEETDPAVVVEQYAEEY